MARLLLIFIILIHGHCPIYHRLLKIQAGSKYLSAFLFVYKLIALYSFLSAVIILSKFVLNDFLSLDLILFLFHSYPYKFYTISI